MTPKASKIYVFHLTVEGKGQFPYDMLRYDRCVPKTGDDVYNMNTSSLYLRQVHLQMYSANKNGPTKDRWESFGWKVFYQEPTTIG